MSKPLLGLVLGGVLGVFDGLSALVSAPNDPAIRAGIVGIVIGSTVKGLLAGALIGWYAKRASSLASDDRVRPGDRVGARLLHLVGAEAGRRAAVLLADHAAGGILGVIVGYATFKSPASTPARVAQSR